MGETEDKEFNKVLGLQSYLKKVADVEYMCHYLGFKDERYFWQMFLWNSRVIRWNELNGLLLNQLTFIEYQREIETQEKSNKDILSRLTKNKP